MKQTTLLFIILLCITSSAYSQYKVTPNKPFSTLRSSPGFVTINEITGGFGLKGKTYPYSKHFIGFTSIFGYQVNGNFFAGGGTGLSFYDAGLLVPLFLDFRFAFYNRQLTPYIFGDGGLMLNFSDLNTTKLFINPGGGVRYTIGKKLGANIGAGILSQVDGENRASFVNIKGGVVYVF
jgi:hypothetical protein